MARPSMGPVALVLLLAWCCAATTVRATEWIVGGDKGWTFGVAGWENDKPIQPGDTLGERPDHTRPAAGSIHHFALLTFVWFDGH